MLGQLSLSYWSGYFTSRQALKGYERLTSALLHAAEKLSFAQFFSINQTSLNAIDNLAQAQVRGVFHSFVREEVS
jgi:hypothetical protein